MPGMSAARVEQNLKYDTCAEGPGGIKYILKFNVMFFQ